MVKLNHIPKECHTLLGKHLQYVTLCPGLPTGTVMATFYTIVRV